jgi:hypothetical protein
MDCGGVLDIRSSIRYLDHFYSYPLMPSMTRSGVLHLVPDKKDTKIKQRMKGLGLKWPGGFVWAAVRTSPFYHFVAMVKVSPA